MKLIIISVNNEINNTRCALTSSDEEKQIYTHTSVL